MLFGIRLFSVRFEIAVIYHGIHQQLLSKANGKHFNEIVRTYFSQYVIHVGQWKMDMEIGFFGFNSQVLKSDSRKWVTK